MNVFDEAGLLPSNDGGPPASIPVELLDQVPCAAIVGPVAMLDEQVWLRCEDGDLAAFLIAFLAAFPRAAEARTRVDLVQVGGRWAAYQDGFRTVTAATVEGLARGMVWQLNRLALWAPSPDVFVHAAVASRGGRALIMPGRSGAGKTTLVTALALGGWSYLSDEVAAVGPDGAVVRPYPRPLALEPGSWELVPEAAGRWPAGVPDLVHDLWLVLPASLGAGEPAAPAVPAAVVFPEVEPGAATRLESISRADALERLLSHSINGVRNGRDGFDRLTGLVRASTCHRLVLDGLDDVEELLAPLVSIDQNGCQ